MDAHVLNLAIPQLSADLRPTADQLLWIVDGYGFLVAGALMTMGALGDRLGRRRVLLAGAAAFGGASLLAAFSTTPAMLIAARALLGVAGATLMPSTLSLIRFIFPDRRRRRTALGVWTASFALGGVVAPLVAGVLLEHFWWGSVFLVALPPMAALLVLGPVLLPEFRDPAAGRLDLVSAVLPLVGVLGVVYGVKRAAQDGVDLPAGAAAVAGLLLVAAFVARQQGRRDPWVDVGLFRRRTFSVPLATNALSFFVLYGTSLFVVQYLQVTLGLSPLQAGLWTIPSSLGYLLGSALAPAAANRLRPARLMSSSLGVAALGFGLLTQLGPRSGLALVVTASVIFSVGLAPVYMLATELTVASAPSERSGAASGILETSAELGGALGVAFLGSLGGAVYRGAVRAELAQPFREEAGNTLGGAVALASRLPEPAAGEVVAAAREAFVTAFRVVEVVGAGLLAVLAVGTLLLLRGARTD
jgi:DHA2 family multidrug resistance protein-like MFS transporter